MEKKPFNKQVPERIRPEEEALTMPKYKRETSVNLLWLKTLIDQAAVLCEPKKADGRDELTIRDLHTREILFFTDDPEQIDFLLEGVRTMK